MALPKNDFGPKWGTVFLPFVKICSSEIWQFFVANPIRIVDSSEQLHPGIHIFILIQNFQQAYRNRKYKWSTKVYRAFHRVFHRAFPFSFLHTSFVSHYNWNLCLLSGFVIFIFTHHDDAHTELNVVFFVNLFKSKICNSLAAVTMKVTIKEYWIEVTIETNEHGLGWLIWSSSYYRIVLKSGPFVNVNLVTVDCSFRLQIFGSIN